MYKSSGPTKEGREGARLKEWYGNYEHVQAWNYLQVVGQEQMIQKT